MKKILSIITVCILAFFACKKDIELLHETVPEVVTGECSGITESSVVLNCNLKSKGSRTVVCGFYYSEAPNNSPTAMDKVITLSIQDRQLFSYTLTGLKENTTYYVRAYARNRVGEAQGKIVQFTTLSKKLPTMGSTSVTNVTTNSATLSGNIASAGTGTVKERGFCISTTKTPTIADSCIAVGSGIGSFNYTLTELEDGVTFYVRAYATSEVGTAYGETMSFTTASEQLPIVVTKSVTEITPWYATLNGELESEGTSSVTEMGFCYSATTQTPTLLDEYVKVNGSSFASVITTLSEGTTYYVRAYATNSKGTAYGDVISFTTLTNSSENIKALFTASKTTAYGTTLITFTDQSTGDIDSWTWDFGRGTSEIIYNQSENPAITFTPGEYTVVLTVKKGTQTSTYTQVITIKESTESIIKNGAIQAEFSVSATKKVYFCQGNLQYRASTGTWRFAENQYDIIGSANANISSSYSGWIDLFGWGTSGYNGKNPYMTSTVDSDYGDGSNDIAGTNYDWGVYNKISNGGNQAGTWRTLTKDEWNYLIKERSNASNKNAAVCVNGIYGFVFLPDNYSLPSGISFIPGYYYGIQNYYTIDEWTRLESIGAVFLPAARQRYEKWIDSNVGDGDDGVYWTSSYCFYAFFWASTNKTNAIEVAEENGGYPSSGFSVRLVQDVE